LVRDRTVHSQRTPGERAVLETGGGTTVFARHIDSHGGSWRARSSVFFCGLDLGQVAPADIAAGPEIKVGSLIDLAGFKAAVVTRRAEVRDYVDVHALMTKANIPLADMLAAASIIYGDQFSPLLSLKALAYHDDAALRELPSNVRRDLTAAVAATDPRRLPVLHAVRTKAASR
jgi:hypothetical protein